MKFNFFNKLFGAVLVILFSAAINLPAQQRFSGGGGFGGFGGFGGGNNNNRSGTTSSGQYNNNGTVGSAIISVDPVTHNIIVIADKETSAQIQRVLESLDAPQLQVLIKVVFLEVQRNDSSEIGVQGNFTGGSWGSGMQQITGYLTNITTSTGSGSNAITTAITSLSPIYAKNLNLGNNFGLPQTLSGATGSGGLYQVLGNDFTATIQAIAAAGKSQVLSRPSILARDGQMAEIVVGQSIYLPSGVSFTSVGGSTTTIPTINGNYQNVGIQLNVTPYIGANNLVQMIIQPQTTSIDTSSAGQQIVGSSLFSGAVFAPKINKRSANTVVVTPDGQPVVIGGLISDQKAKSESKVPFLGDIPILGQLFRATAKSEGKTELLMFLTPHIVQTPNQLAGMVVPEMSQAPQLTNSISEEELDRFLERIPVKKSEPVKRKK